MRRAPALFMAVFLLFSLCGCAGAYTDPPADELQAESALPAEPPSITASQEPHLLRLAVSSGDDDPTTVAARAFAAAVEEETNGQYQIQVFAAGMLGSDEDLIRTASAGQPKADFIIAPAAAFSVIEPDMAASAMPFLFCDTEEALAFMDGPVEAAVEETLTAKNLRILAHFDGGFRCMTSAVSPITGPYDLDGLRMRCPMDDPLTDALFRAFDATAQPLPDNELYQELLLGNCDGQENTVSEIVRNCLYEVQKYLSLTGHSYVGICLAVSEQVWNGLSGKEQSVFMEAAQTSAVQNRTLSSERTEALLATLALHMEIAEPDREAFRLASMRVYADNPVGISDKTLAALSESMDS